MSFQIRIKTSSKLEQALQYMLDNPKNSREDMRAAGFTCGEATTAWALARHSDNFMAGRYVEVSPQTIIQNQTVTGATAAAIVNEQIEDKDTQVRFPQAPALLGWNPIWQKPVFYNRMKAMVTAGKHIAVSGPPGIGKSTAVQILACESNMPLVSVSSDSGLRRRDLTGNPELVNGHTRFDVAEYAAAAVHGWWVMIDEINAAEPDALMYLNSQLAAPYRVNFYGRSYPVHPNFRLFATYNAGLVGTKPLPDSLKDRFFPIKLEFPNPNQLRSMLVANGMNHIEHMNDQWMDAIVKYGELAWQQHLDGRMRYQITPRRLMDAVLLVQHNVNVFEALKDAVVAAVDNTAEAKVLNNLVNQLKSELAG